MDMTVELLTTFTLIFIVLFVILRPFTWLASKVWPKKEKEETDAYIVMVYENDEWKPVYQHWYINREEQDIDRCLFLEEKDAWDFYIELRTNHRGELTNNCLVFSEAKHLSIAKVGYGTFRIKGIVAGGPVNDGWGNNTPPLALGSRLGKKRRE